MMESSKTRGMPPTHIALAYNGLGDTETALQWLEKAFAEHDPKMTFLKVDPKWNNLLYVTAFHRPDETNKFSVVLDKYGGGVGAACVTLATARRSNSITENLRRFRDGEG